MKEQIRRRRVLGSIGTLATTGFLAGCSTETRDETDGGDGGSNDGDDGDGGDGDNFEMPEWPEYISDATDEGTEDMRGESSVTVTVGPGGNFSFGPTRVVIDSGTEITFEWDSDFHNVVPESQPDGTEWEGSPGEDTYDTGYSFSSTLDVAGMYAYYCQPHEAQGMKAAIYVVGEDGEDGTPTATEGDGTPTATEGDSTPTATAGEDGEIPEWPSFVDDAKLDNFEDLRGQSEVTVEAGAGESGLAFDPTKIAVDAGTEVTWEFVSPSHNVKPESQPDGADFSGSPGDEFATIEEGETHSETLDTPGMYTYYCAPHKGAGMKGAIYVEE